MTDDVVNNPPHYTQGKYEVIDVLEDWFSDDPLAWQVGKYIARYKHKNGVEDLKKARFYLNRLIDQYEDKPEAEPRVWQHAEDIPEDVQAVWSSGISLAMRSKNSGWWWVESPDVYRPLTRKEWAEALVSLERWDEHSGWEFMEFHAPFTEAVVLD